MNTKISQREARRLRKRVVELSTQLNSLRKYWANEFPGGTHIGRLVVGETNYVKVHTAMRLGHAVVVTAPNDNELNFFALKAPVY